MNDNFSKFVKKSDENCAILSFFERDSFVASISYMKEFGNWKYTNIFLPPDTIRKYPDLTKTILNLGDKEIKKYQR